jgi:hypothetical protein
MGKASEKRDGKRYFCKKKWQLRKINIYCRQQFPILNKKSANLINLPPSDAASLSPARPRLQRMQGLSFFFQFKYYFKVESLCFLPIITRVFRMTLCPQLEHHPLAMIATNQRILCFKSNKNIGI